MKIPPASLRFSTDGKRMTHRRARPEQVIQRCVFEHLRLRSQPATFSFHPANGGFRTPIEAKILKGQGVVAGTPDVIVIKAGRVYALELKSPDGRISDAQRSTMDAMTAAGAICSVAYSLDEALAVLERWQVLRGRTV
jgi:hypothetical protein